MLINYVSLYRKYRPLRFSEVIGQDVSIKILTNSILKGEVFHAYIFSGTRGTGKTTVARILARALNCINLKGFEPCNECYNCKSIINSSFPDVIEIDAASNRGINEIREIRDNVKLSPLKGKYKVYIIDEVHMLTLEAFNALLKTLEEPPKNVVFILATTDIHKVPITILSRCQQIEFKRVSSELIFKNLKNICQKEGINIEDDALKYIAKVSKGSVRDSISILEQVKNISDNITLDDIFQIFSIYSFELIRNYIYNVLSANIKQTIEIVNIIRANSVNIYNFLYNLNTELREIIYYYFNPEVIENDLTKDQVSFYRNVINRFDIRLIYDLLRNLSFIMDFYKNDNDYYLFEIQTLSFIFNLSKDKFEIKETKDILKNEKESKQDKELKNKRVLNDIRELDHINEIEQNNKNNSEFHKIEKIDKIGDINSEDNLEINKSITNEISNEITNEISKEEEEIEDLVKDVGRDIKNDILFLVSDKSIQSAIKATDRIIIQDNKLIFYYDNTKKINQTYKNLIKISREKIKSYITSKYKIEEIIVDDELKKKTLI